MNAKKVKVCSVLGLACVLLTQPSCATQPQQLHQKKQPIYNQLPQPKALPAPKEIPANKPVANTRQITIKNNITTGMLAYTYLFIKYSPSIFTVSVNGQQIEPGQEKTITVTDNKIKVQYHFEFSVHRSGTRSAEYSVAKTPQVASLTFGWKKKIRISIDGTTPISAEEVMVK